MQASKSQGSETSQPNNVLDWWQNYLTDAWQRVVLYHNVMRQRGNQYHAHLAEDTPPCLEHAFRAYAEWS